MSDLSEELSQVYQSLSRNSHKPWISDVGHGDVILNGFFSAAQLRAMADVLDPPRPSSTVAEDLMLRQCAPEPDSLNWVVYGCMAFAGAAAVLLIYSAYRLATL